MIRRPPRSTRTDTLFPYTTLFRSQLQPVIDRALAKRSKHPFILPELGPMMVKFGKSTIYGAPGGRIAVGVDVDAKLTARTGAPTTGRIWMTEASTGRATCRERGCQYM